MSNNRDFRSILADSGPLKIEYGYEITVSIPHFGETTIPLPGFPNPWKTQYRARLGGFTWTQWNWIRNTAEGQDHVFFFTHGRIVGGGEEQRGRLMFRTEDFVEWANQDDVNVHAVFNGHWHRNNIFYNVHTNPDEEGYIGKPREKDNPTQLHHMEFTEPTYYIETEASTGG